MPDITPSTIKPFLKWAGGKTQLLPDIDKRLPRFIKEHEKFNYVEPFVGSGAVMFFLFNKYGKNMNKIIINDLNKRLIYLYETVLHNPTDLVERMSEINIHYKKTTHAI